MRRWIATTTSSLALLCLAACGGGGSSERVAAPPSGLYETPQYSTAQVAVTRNLVYSTQPNLADQYTSDQSIAADQASPTLQLKTDVWTPPNATAAGAEPQPLVIYIHGGDYVNGDKEEQANAAMAFAQTGYVAASINYRLTPNNDTSAERRALAITTASTDMMNAVRYFKANAARFNIDPERIVTIGASAGGGLSLINAVNYDTLVGTSSQYTGYSSRVAAAVSTGATLTNSPSYDLTGLLTFTGNTPVMMFHANPTDGYTGATWVGDVLPTQLLIQTSGTGGNTCSVESQPNLTHTVAVFPGSNYWDTLRPFLLTQLNL